MHDDILRKISTLGIGFFLALVLTVGNASGAPQIAWSTQFGNGQFCSAFEFAFDSSGALYVIGQVSGDLFGESAGETDAYVVKYSPSGTQLWGRQFGSSKADTPVDVAVDANANVYVVGFTEGSLYIENPVDRDAFVVKYSPTGDLVWSKQLHTDRTDAAFGVAVDQQENVIVVGSTTGVLFGEVEPIGSAGFIAKYTSAGGLIWGKQLWLEHSTEATAVAVGAQDSLLIAGATEDLFDQVGDMLDEDSFLLKLSAPGEQVWGRQFGTENRDGGSAVAVDAQGSIYVAGTMSIQISEDGTEVLGASGYLAKYDASGDQLWLRQLTSVGIDEAFSVGLDGAGNIYVVGDTSGDLFGTSAGQQDAFIARYDASGTVQWSYQFGTSADDGANGVGVDPAGNVYVVGYSEGSLYGTNSGSSDTFIVKFAAVAAPTFDPDGGVHGSPQEVAIASGTSGATIRYTTDGTDPTESSSLYTAPVAISQTTTLKAKAWKTDYLPSIITSATYELKLPALTFAPDAGTYQGTQNVTIACAVGGATIRYTTDGTDPTESSTEYTGPVAISQSRTLKARAWKTGWTPSDIKSAEYVIQ